jgi:cytochrome subunit of sulfide dehydrogenase
MAAAHEGASMRPISWRLPCMCLAALACASAAAQGVDRQARAWAASCAACHGGEPRAGAPIPPLAPMSAEQLYGALIEFKTGRRPQASVMHQQAKGYTDDELRRIAQALAARR